MNNAISVKDKQTFLNWFLNHYRLKKRESFWILNYLLKHPRNLNHVHFVHDITYCPRSMVIATACSDETAFLFYKSQVITTDAEKAFHDLRLNQEDSIYIQLQFNNSNQNIMLAGILEENPFMKHEHIITKQDKESATQLLHTSIHSYQKQTLLKQIDGALDKKDKHLFNELTKELRTLDLSDGGQPMIQQ